MKKYEGTLIFEEKDAHGPVEVVDRPSIRTLHFGTAVEQSSMFLERPFDLEMEYVRTMALSLLFKPKPQSVLCLGLGGASLPKFIWKYFPHCTVTVVELRPLVIEAALQFFEVPQDKGFEIICDDAFHYLESDKAKQHDLLFVDLYTSEGMAPLVSENEFLSLCDKYLKPGGILVSNLWQSASQQMLQSFVQNLTQNFGRNQLLLPNKESSNFILLAFKNPIDSYTKKQIELEAKKLQKISNLDLRSILQQLKFFKGYGYLFQDWH